ncbi:FAR1-related sequence 11-like protein [Tanacetum coccineum]
MRLTLKKSFDIFPEEWHVTKFIKDHNHEPLSHEEMRFLPANCIITPEDEQEILLYKEAGLNVREIIRVMELKKNVKHGGLSFLDKDVHNLFTKTFVTIMKKPSKTIITDQDPWMSQTISIEMPTTKHSFCIWHITSKFSCWFSALLRTEYQSWCGDFYTLYRMTYVEEFEHNWPIFVAKYNLQNNNHVQGLYEIRMSWAPCYLRNYFFGGMTSTSRSESINAFIKRFVSSRTSLKDFVRQVELAIEEIENSEAHNKMKNSKEQVDNLQRSAKDNEISMDETSIKNEDILLDNMPGADNDILCPPKGRPRKGREKGGKESATKGQNRCSLCKQ